MTTEQVEGLELREQVYSEALSAMGACRISGELPDATVPDRSKKGETGV
jgi:hypothetical protein